MRRYRRWLIVIDEENGPRPVKEIEDFDLARMYEIQMRPFIQGVRLVANPSRIVEELVGYGDRRWGHMLAGLWAAMCERLSGEWAGRMRRCVE